MRARLLDMGEVSATRSQSIYHAIAAAMSLEDNPVAILLRPASRLISIGADRDPASEIDLELCLKNRLPVLRRLLGGPAELVGQNRLLFSFLRPEKSSADIQALTPAPLAEACRSLGLRSILGPKGEILVEDRAARRPCQVGTSQTGVFEGSSCLTASLARDPEPHELDSVLKLHRGDQTGNYPPSSLTRELEDHPDFATVAEALVDAVEKAFDVEFVPSMPTPDEMDAIYEWDERLALDLELATTTDRQIAIN